MRADQLSMFFQPSLRAPFLHRCEAERRRDDDHPGMEAVQGGAGVRPTLLVVGGKRTRREG
jgi:hypothetical protein